MPESVDALTSRRVVLAGALGAGGLALTGAEAAAAAPIPQSPSSSFFLEFDPVIQGESTDSQHVNWIELLTWSFGDTTSIAPTNIGSGASKSKPSDFIFVARLSKASPVLFEAVATGKRYATATLDVSKSGAARFSYLKVTLGNLYVSSYQVAPGESDGFPLDVVHLRYGNIKYAYTQQKPDGSLGTTTQVRFDFIANKAL